MQVNPIGQYNNINRTFGSLKKTENISKTDLTKDEILKKKTKKAVSECLWVVLGFSIVYFAMRTNFKLTRMKNIAEDLQKKKELEIPASILPDLKRVVS